MKSIVSLLIVWDENGKEVSASVYVCTYFRPLHNLHAHCESYCNTSSLSVPGNPPALSLSLFLHLLPVTWLVRRPPVHSARKRLLWADAPRARPPLSMPLLCAPTTAIFSHFGPARAFFFSLGRGPAREFPAAACTFRLLQSLALMPSADLQRAARFHSFRRPPLPHDDERCGRYTCVSAHLHGPQKRTQFYMVLEHMGIQDTCSVCFANFDHLFWKMKKKSIFLSFQKLIWRKLKLIFLNWSHNRLIGNN
jgi:hypothetical protein